MGVDLLNNSQADLSNRKRSYSLVDWRNFQTKLVTLEWKYIIYAQYGFIRITFIPAPFALKMDIHDTHTVRFYPHENVNALIYKKKIAL